MNCITNINLIKKAILVGSCAGMRSCLSRLTTPRIPTTVIPMVMLVGVEKFFTGRSRFLGNKFFSSLANKDSGVGFVQFNIAAIPVFKEKVENTS